MGDTVRFCEGCPFANGVEEGEAEVRGFVMAQPAPDFEVFVQDDEGNVSESLVTVPSYGATDAGMPARVVQHLEQATQACAGPAEGQRKLLGGLLGSRAIRQCGAFPGQDPAHIRIGVR